MRLAVMKCADRHLRRRLSHSVVGEGNHSVRKVVSR